MQVALPGRADGRSRPAAGADRPAAVSGAIRAGARPTRARSARRSTTPTSICERYAPLAAQKLVAAAASSTPSARWCGNSRARCERPRQRGQRAPAAHLRAHHRADPRARRLAPGRPGQHRARGRPERHRRASPSCSRSGVSSRWRRTASTRAAEAARAGRSCASRRSIASQARASRSARCSPSTTRSTPRPARCGCARCSTTNDFELFPNQFVNTRLLLDVGARRALTSRRRPLQRGANATFVFVVKPDRTVDPAPVTIGTDRGRPDRRSSTGFRSANAWSCKAETACTKAARSCCATSRSTLRRAGRARESVAALHPATGGDHAAR